MGKAVRIQVKTGAELEKEGFKFRTGGITTPTGSYYFFQKFLGQTLWGEERHGDVASASTVIPKGAYTLLSLRKFKKAESKARKRKPVKKTKPIKKKKKSRR